MSQNMYYSICFVWVLWFRSEKVSEDSEPILEIFHARGPSRHGRAWKMQRHYCTRIFSRKMFSANVLISFILVSNSAPSVCTSQSGLNVSCVSLARLLSLANTIPSIYLSLSLTVSLSFSLSLSLSLSLTHTLSLSLSLSCARALSFSLSLSLSLSPSRERLRGLSFSLCLSLCPFLPPCDFLWLAFSRSLFLSLSL